MNPGHGWVPTLLAAWQRPQPDLLARTLQPLSWLYRGLLAGRRALFASGLRHSERAPRPLIVVGNLVVGGAGKTPTVIALVAVLRRLGHTPGVVSRGYGRGDRATRLVDARSVAAHVGDEPLLIHLRARVPVAVARRRIDAARALCDAHPELDVLVADDGLQHLALARDAQVIVFDERGAGNGLLLPAGPLREPLPDTLPARTLVLYNAAQPSTPLPGHVVQRALVGVVALDRWWQGDTADPQGWDALRGRRVVACAGTAVPQRFFSMLQAQGLELEPLALPDHADFDRLPWADHAQDVVVTEKDAVKIRPERVGRARVWVAPLDFRLDDAVGQALVHWLPPAT
jgi:tetraacyldisaccharide 4'-kinase